MIIPPLWYLYSCSRFFYFCEIKTVSSFSWPGSRLFSIVSGFIFSYKYLKGRDIFVIVQERHKDRFLVKLKDSDKKIVIDNAQENKNKIIARIENEKNKARERKEKKKKGRIAWAGPILAGGHLILVSSDAEVVKVAPDTGELVATQKIEDGSVVAPVVAGEKIYILTEEGKLIAMR